MRISRSKRNLNRVEFLEELRRESAIHFAPDVAAAMLLEVEAHLDESIQGRIDLGESKESAERQAVTSFHDPKRFVQSMGSVHENTVLHDRPLLLIGLALVSWLGLTLELASKGITWFSWVIGVVVLGLMLLVRSIQIGSVRKGTLAVLFLANVVVIGGFLPLNMVNTGAYGGMGYMPISMAREYVTNPRVFVEKRSNHRESFMSYMPSESELERVQATKAALAAPLIERYATNASETIQVFIFTFAFITLGHLAPVAVRRRLTQRSARRATAA